MTTKHAPTPWFHWVDKIKSQEEGWQSDKYICEIPNSSSSHIDDAEARANAAHIVKCVNMHYELVEMLREGEDIISGLEAALDNAGNGDMVEARGWWNRAYELIAKAEGK